MTTDDSVLSSNCLPNWNDLELNSQGEESLSVLGLRELQKCNTGNCSDRELAMACSTAALASGNAAANISEQKSRRSYKVIGRAQ